MELKVGLVCDRGLNPKRPVNQDRFLAIANRGVFAVFDGVGGQRAGEVASQTAADTIEEALAHSANNNSSSEMIDRAIQFANRDILEMAEGNAALETMATTVALIHIQGDQATVAHVGDSRVYRLEDGRFYRETIDHTDANDSRDGIGERSSAIHSNVITRALGVESQVEVELKSIPLRDGARFLLCSDGIYKHVPDEEIASVLSRNEEPQGAADELKRIVYQRGADDNLTAVVVQVGRGVKFTNRDVKPGRASGKRIEVPFGGGGSLDTAPPGTGGSMRKLMYILVVLVLIAGAYYAGLRTSGLLKSGAGTRIEGLPTNPLSAGIEEFNKGRYREAGVQFTAVAARAPQNPEPWYWLGRSQLELGEYETAAANLERAGLEMYEANLYGAAAYRAAGNKARAEALLERYNEELRRRQHRDQQ